MKMSAYALKQQTYHNPSLEASFGNGSTINQDTFSISQNVNKFGSLKPDNTAQARVSAEQLQSNKENVLSETKTVCKSIKGILKQSSKGVNFDNNGLNTEIALDGYVDNSLFYNTNPNVASNYQQQDGVENLLSRVDILLSQKSKIPIKLENGYQSVTSYQNYSSTRQVSVNRNTDIKSYLANLESKVLRNKSRDNQELKKSSKLAVQMKKKQQKYIKNKKQLSDSSSSSSSGRQDLDSDSNSSSSSSSEEEQEQIKRKIMPNQQARKVDKEQKQRSFSESRGNNKQNNLNKFKEQRRQEEFINFSSGGHFATDLVFCVVCEDYIEAGKVDEHSKHCQENQPLLLSKSRRINNYENSEWRYQQERINQKLMKLKIYLEELPVTSNSSQNLRLIVDNLVGTSMRLIQNNSSQPILMQAVSDLISLKAKVLQEETPSNKPIILSTLVLQDKLKHFARKKLDLIEAQQQGLFSAPAQDYTEDTKTHSDIFSDYQSLQSFKTQKTKSTTRIFTDIKYQPRQQPFNIQQQRQYLQQVQVQEQQLNHQYQQQTQLLQQQMKPQQNIPSIKQNLLFNNRSSQPPRQDNIILNQVNQAEDNTKELNIEMKKKLFFEAAVKFKKVNSQHPKVQTLLVSDLYKHFSESGLSSDQIEDFLHSIIQKQ